MNIIPKPNPEADPAMVNMLTRGTKIVGGALISGALGFAAARGIEQFLIPMDSNHADIFEATVTLASAAITGFLIYEITD